MSYALDPTHLSSFYFILQGSVTSSAIGWFAGFDGAQEEYGTGLGPGEGCEGLDFVNDGGVDGINSEGLGVHVLEIGEDVRSCLI